MKKKYVLDLQLFADGGDGTGTGDGNGGGSEGDGSNNTGKKDKGEGGKGEGDNPPSFDDLLKDTKHQAEFDRRVQQAIQTATTGLDEKYRVLMDNKVSEAEKLTKMTKEERVAYETKKREEEFEVRVASFEQEKLLVVIKDDLQKQSLPISFAQSLVAISDATKIKDAIAELKQTWDAEITEAIKSKARQTTPSESGQTNATGTLTMDIGKMARENRIIK